ncbi:Translation initiation factor IF-3, C-terminal domain [Nesidiocoris tenuis]|uniref:Translation initiation factor IF-3, C-terminal domain n=1 Tax=Nesidiocoris tenuis TaxID=355587 RepID=A0ABN7BF73_9HEMI|nr:Translation initiation factor IF-3, C-terminal domain [Nesidiocoris tenuis]
MSVSLLGLRNSKTVGGTSQNLRFLIGRILFSSGCYCPFVRESVVQPKSIVIGTCRFKTATPPTADKPQRKTPEQIEAEERKKAKREETHIALIQLDKTIVHTTLEDAKKLSNRRSLNLVKVADYDRKRDSPVYKLLTGAQFRAEELNLTRTKGKDDQQKGAYKGEKLVQINAKIGQHDLDSKINNILSWLKKNYQIRITITSSDQRSLAESVFKKIETGVSDNGRILQKRETPSDIKFQVIPPKAASAAKAPAETTQVDPTQ